MTGSAVLALTLAVLLVWRVSQEPLSLAFLAPYLSESLELSDTGLHVEMSDVVLTWDREDQALRLRVLNARVSGNTPGLMVQLPEVDLSLSGPSLLRGVLAPKFLKISGVRAQVIREMDGHFLFGLPDAGAEPVAAGSQAPVPEEQVDLAALMFGALFEHLSQPKDFGDPLSQLEAVTLGVNQLVILDRKLGQRWVMPSLNLRLYRADRSVHAEFSGLLDWRGKELELTGAADYSAADRAARVSTQFTGIKPSDFADLMPSLQPLAILDSTLSGTLGFILDQGGVLRDLSVDVEAGPGKIEKPQYFTEQLQLLSANLRGRFETQQTGEEVVHIDRFEARFDDRLALEAAGTVLLPSPGRVGLDVKGKFTGLPASHLKRYWPLGMATNARDWVTGHIRDGEVTLAEFAAKLTPDMLDAGRRLPRDAISLAFSFTGLGVDYFPPLPRMIESSGRARLDADTFALSMDTGRIGTMRTSEGRLLITGLQDRDQFADIGVTVRGANRDMLALIDRRPLGFPTKVGIRPDSVAGEGEVVTSFRFPLESNLRLDDVKFTAKADLWGVTLPAIYDRFDLKDGRMRLTVDQNGLDAEGRAALNGVDANVRWRQEFSSKAAVTARYRISGEVNDAGRKALGFELDPFITGPLYADAEIESRSANSETLIKAQLDLTASRFALPELFAAKEPGRAGKASFTASLRPGQPTRFENLVLNAGNFDMQGAAVYGVDRSWDVNFTSLALDSGALTGRFRRAANGDITVSAEGKAFNLTKFVEEATAEPPPGFVPQPGPKFDLRLRLDETRIEEKTQLSRFALDLHRGPLWVERLDLAGAFPTGGALAVKIQAAGKNRELKLQSENAGAVFQYLGIENMVGGSVTVEGTYRDDQPGNPLAGTLVARDFKAVQAPFLARLFGIGSFTGLAALLSGEGLLFETANVPFRQHDGVLTIQPSRIQGPQLGITLEGKVDRRSNQVNVTGTAVPAFVLNTILGRIPVLGDLFIGEGIVGVNFAVTGPREKTEMSVNPLSAIAPGFLRRIFQASGSTASEPAPPTPTPTPTPDPKP